MTDRSAMQLKAIVERIERLEEEKKAIGDDIREVYAEAKGNGYDTKALRAIVRLRRLDAHERREQQAVLETYMAALGMLPGAEVPDELPRASRGRGRAAACRADHHRVLSTGGSCPAEAPRSQAAVLRSSRSAKGARAGMLPGHSRRGPVSRVRVSPVQATARGHSPPAARGRATAASSTGGSRGVPFSVLPGMPGRLRLGTAPCLVGPGGAERRGTPAIRPP